MSLITEHGPGRRRTTRAPRALARRDAARNRAALTAAAANAFREEGLDIAVDEIARRAGVGVGTPPSSSRPTAGSWRRWPSTACRARSG